MDTEFVYNSVLAVSTFPSTPPQEPVAPGDDGPGAITIRELATLSDYQECCRLQDETWGHGFSERVPTAILSVSQKIGGVTAGAFDSTGRMLGFVFGMTGIRDGVLTHWSDMLAVREEARGANLGERLKQYQRERVLELGVDVMLWTFDPLVARNAHFNVNRLGARPTEYIPEMYGSNTGSVLHGETPTDRLIVTWRLRSDRPRPEGADLARPGDAELPLANPLDAGGSPRAVDVAGTIARIQVPRDPADMRASAAVDRSLAWRMAVRSSFVTLMGRGLVITRFVRAHAPGALPYYVLEPG